MRERIKEVVVVEGREDERALRNALLVETIATHGFGISKDTWARIETAYLGPGIIVLTDPDSAGDLIRKRISETFPQAKHAYLAREEARNGKEIGVEHASPECIIDALEKARCRTEIVDKDNLFTIDDLAAFHLVGEKDAGEKRDKLGKSLGIGYGNTKTFLRRLNHYGISREEYYRHGEALFHNDHS